MSIEWKASRNPDARLYDLIADEVAKPLQPDGVSDRMDTRSVFRLPLSIDCQEREESGFFSFYAQATSPSRALEPEEKDVESVLRVLRGFFGSDFDNVETRSKPLGEVLRDDVLEERQEAVFRPVKERVAARFEPSCAMPDLPTDLMPPPSTTIFSAVIDEAIPILNERFRRFGGDESRIQGALIMEAHSGANCEFGREVFKPEIDRAIQAIQNGHSDERTQYQNMGLLSADRVRWDSLQHAATHGAATADLSAGHDCRDASAQNAPAILAVSMPPRQSVGIAGANLEGFVSQALEWITLRADALFQKLPQADRKGVEGYCIVVTLAFGQQAGARDGSDTLAQTITRLKTKYGDRLHIVMPAGNANHKRAHARFSSGAGPTVLPLRLPPQDQTPTIVEIWTDPVRQSSQAMPALSVAGPGKTPLTPVAPPGPASDGDIKYKGKTVGRAYYRVGPHPSGKVRHRFVLAFYPTDTQADHGETLQAGLWQIQFNYGVKTMVTADIEVDQIGLLGSHVAREAYFDDPMLTRFDDTGTRLIDAGDIRQAAPVMHGVVTQYGTLNALVGPHCIVVGGHDATNGKPAAYSGTSDHPNQIALSMPGDASAALPGLLCTGTFSGSTSRLSGTSASVALAARQMIALLSDPNGPGPSAVVAAMQALAQQANPHWARTLAPAVKKRRAPPKAKIGQGRMPMIATSRVNDRGV